MKYLPGIFIAALLFCFNVSAQSAKIEREIVSLRDSIAKAIKGNDKTALENLIADDFVHTHATGKINNKAQRIASLLDGSPTIESVQPEEIRFRVFGSQTVVANGKTTVEDSGGKISYRWTAVYYRHQGKWRVITTQATILAD